jgi:hypothetical protein
VSADARERTFDVWFNGQVSLTVDEVWPDGDAPEYPQAADVIEEMKKTGSISALLGDWGLTPSLEVFVDMDKVEFP